MAAPLPLSRIDPLNWVLLLILGMIWGASFMGVSLALTGFTPMTIAALRISGAAILLTLVALISGIGLPGFRAPQDRRIWMHAIGMGIFSNALPFSVLSWAQKSVTSGFAGITMALVPLFILPLAHVFIPSERMHVFKVIGFAIGFYGVFVLIGAENIFGDFSAALPSLACVFASLCYACGSIITRRTPPTNLIRLSASTLICGAVILLPLALWVEGVPTMPEAPLALLGVTYLAIFPTAVAQLMLVRVISTAGSSFMSMVNYQVPIWAVIFGALLLNEQLPAHFMSALMLILLGLAITQYGRKLWLRFAGPA